MSDKSLTVTVIRKILAKFDNFSNMNRSEEQEIENQKRTGSA